ncbi:MAG: hypothetical protein LIO90_05000 [Bacteroidales bacterium]|nr:hypothetical protein [Bacteroidales bacterium]
MDILRYKDEDDKCYGATGMAIGIVVFDGEEMLSAVSLDGDAADIMEMHDRFYFSGNPSLSAKSSWHQMISNFNITSAMLISNVLCRALVRNGVAVTPEVRKAIHDILVEEGHNECSLEADEIERLFNKNYSHLNRIFSHHGVQSIAHDFARVLKAQRRMTRSDVIEQLRALTLL